MFHRTPHKRIGMFAKLYTCLLLLAIVSGLLIQHRQILTSREKEIETRKTYLTKDLYQIGAFINTSLSLSQNAMMNFFNYDGLDSLSHAQLTDMLYRTGKSSTCTDTYYLKSNKWGTLSGDDGNYEISDTPELNNLIHMSGLQKNAFLYSDVYYSHTQGNYSLACAITPAGSDYTAAVEINLAYYTTYISQLLGNDSWLSFMVTDMDGNIIMSDPSHTQIAKAKATYPLQPTAAYQKVAKMEYANDTLYKTKHIEQEYLISNHDNNMNWHLILLADKAYFTSNLGNIYKSYYIDMTLWILLFGFALLFIVYVFTRRFKLLASVMDRVTDIETLVEIPSESQDEIGRLAHNYNRLIKKIRELLRKVKDTEEKKKQYEIRMLQNQIGPHFLYNTLICIRSLINQKSYEPAKTSMTELCHLLTYSFDKKEELVTLTEEIEEITSYIRIAKMRFGDRFHLRVELPEMFGDCLLPKLTLQPLVENAIFHGLIPKDSDDGLLVIRAFAENEDLLIQIYDNGIGMSDSMVANILSQKVNKSRERVSSIGVANVNERIKLTYGPGYGITILSVPEKGTTVEIRLKVLRPAK